MSICMDTAQSVDSADTLLESDRREYAFQTVYGPFGEWLQWAVGPTDGTRDTGPSTGAKPIYAPVGFIHQ